MSAVLRPGSVLDMIVDDVRHGATLRTYELEPHDCVHFLNEAGWPIGDWVLDSCGEKYARDDKWRAKFDAIWTRILNGKETFDDMGDLRDLMRNATIEVTSKSARTMAEDALR
jgi:hypothetical protein